MARIKRDTVSYFPHDAEGNSDALTVLEGRYQHDGYAFYYKLREKLARSDGHFLDLRNVVKWKTFATKMGLTEETTLEMVILLVEMGEIDRELWNHRIIWCQELVNDLEEVYKNRKRKTPSKPIITGNNVITTVEKGIITTEIPQSRVEESRVEESRVTSSSSMCKKDVQKIYEQNIGELTEAIEAEIDEAIEEYSAGWVADAIREAARQNKRNWSYVMGILRNWKTYGKNSIESKWHIVKR